MVRLCSAQPISQRTIELRASAADYSDSARGEPSCTICIPTVGSDLDYQLDKFNFSCVVTNGGKLSGITVISSDSAEHPERNGGARLSAEFCKLLSIAYFL